MNILDGRAVVVAATRSIRARTRCMACCMIDNLKDLWVGGRELEKMQMIR